MRGGALTSGLRRCTQGRGAPGPARDDLRRAVKPLYTEETWQAPTADERLGYPASTRSRAALTRPCTAGSCGRCASSGLRHRRGDQRALPLPARSRQMGLVHRVRHAHAHGTRLRPRPQPGRGRPEGVAVDTLDDMLTLYDGISPGHGHHLNDDQRARAILLAFLCLRR